MLELKPKAKLSSEAHILARGHHMVRFNSKTYMPCNYITKMPGPADEETIWIPINRKELQRTAAGQFGTLFGSEGELNNFEFMVAQSALQKDDAEKGLFVKTTEGLRVLDADGQLVEPDTWFRPNYIRPTLVTDKAAQLEVFDVIKSWVGGAEEAHSLLRHLATCLAPHYSAVKYVLFLGEGRNGKSVLMKMLAKLFGPENASHITRQEMAEKSPTVLELNGMLLNMVYDGSAEYLKDSGTEKTLIAGEPVAIRRLYESNPTPVQTNALFVESLNAEPKSKDKSSALQKRLIRFRFPNVYELDIAFEKKMLAPESLGAFLGLLIEHYVKEDEVAAALAPTTTSIELQIEHTYVNSLALQYLQHVQYTGMLGVQELLDQTATELASGFRAWRIQDGDLNSWSEPDVRQLFKPLLVFERKSKRIGQTVQKTYVVTGLAPDAITFINSLKGDDDAGTPGAELVGD